MCMIFGRRFWLLLVLLLSWVMLNSALATTDLAKGISPALQSNAFFEKNNGQYAADVLYAFKGKRGIFFIKENKAEFIIFAALTSSAIDPRFSPSSVNAVSVEMQFFQASQAKQILGIQPLSAHINYLSTEKKSAREELSVSTNASINRVSSNKVSLYEKVKIKNIYPNIDLIFRFRDGSLEYDYWLHPGANPDDIKLKISGAEKIQNMTNGQLLISTEFGELIHDVPEIFQFQNSFNAVHQREDISGRFRLDGDIISFIVDDYAKDKLLVIDPVINFSTYMGGVYVEQIKGLKVDSDGNIFVAGTTSASAVLQEDSSEPSGIKLTYGYEKFIGDDFVFDKKDFIAVEQEANFINAESVASANALQNIHGIKNCNYEYQFSKRGINVRIDYDAFFAKYAADGTLLYATYIGGCGNDAVRDMDIDIDGDIYLGGFTLSEDFPTKAALQNTLAALAEYEEDIADRGDVNSDGFIMKFANDGALIYSTYIGGDDLDGVRAIKVDSNKRLYIVGYTYSRFWVNANPVCITDNLETTASKCFQGSDGFVARLAATGDVLAYLNIIGGAGDDWTNSLALVENPADLTATQVYISGNTVSPDLLPSELSPSYLAYKPGSGACSRADPPVDFDTHPCEDAYFMRLSNGAASIDFASYLGGDFDDTAVDIDTDAMGNIYVGGTTSSRGGTIESMFAIEPLIDTTRVILNTEDSADLTATKELLLQSFPLYRRYLATPLVDDGQRRVFVTKFNPSGDQLIYSTFLNGLKQDSGSVMEVTDAGVVYIAGQTTSIDFPVVDAFSRFPKSADAFVSKIESDLIKAIRQDGVSVDQVNLSFSTYLGGEDDDYITAMSVVENNANSEINGIYLGGGTESRAFPITQNASQAEYQGGGSDVFLMHISQQESNTDLQLDLNVSDKELNYINEEIAYNIAVNNNGGILAEQVTLWIEISGGTMGVNISSANFSCVNSNQTENANPVIYRCDLGDLAANQVIEQAVNITLTPSYVGIFTLSSSLSSLISDLTPENNARTSSIEILSRPSRASLSFSVVFWAFVCLFMFTLLRYRDFCSTLFVRYRITR